MDTSIAGQHCTEHYAETNTFDHRSPHRNVSTNSMTGQTTGGKTIASQRHTQFSHSPSVALTLRVDRGLCLYVDASAVFMAVHMLLE